MTVSAFVERPPEPKQFSNDELLAAFREYKEKFGDVGLAVTAMHLEALKHIASLEERLAKLEAKRR
jgi:hypothetical protein